MSSPPTINHFKGTDWEECNAFILAIREAAWKEGKLRDLAWMADLASLHFSHRALSWHSRLPQDIREDWAKLQVALLDRWPPPEDDDEPRIEPTPAAAPSLAHNNRADRPLNGILKVVVDGTNTISYIKSRDAITLNSLTDTATEALRIRCLPSSNAIVLERVDGSRHSWLGIQLANTEPDLNNGSTDYGYLVLVEAFNLRSSWTAIFPYQLASCTVSANWEVIPLWENDNTSKITIGIFFGDGILSLAVDPDAYSKSNPTRKRARIFIEQLDEPLR